MDGHGCDEPAPTLALEDGAALAPRHVHGDFHAEPEVNCLRNLPSHRTYMRLVLPHFSQARPDMRHSYAPIS
jgi:hypothetical protein